MNLDSISAASLFASSNSSAWCTIACTLALPTLCAIAVSMNSMPFSLLLGRAKGVVSPTAGECSSTGLIFKGSGFYETDYKRKKTEEKKSCPAPKSDSCKGCSLNKEKPDK